MGAHGDLHCGRCGRQVVPRGLPRTLQRKTPGAVAVRWVFINLASGNPFQIVTTPDERDRFMRYCNREGIRGGLIRVDETGIVVEHPVSEG